MTQDEIVNLAIQAGASPDEKLWLMYSEELVVFAKLITSKYEQEIQDLKNMVMELQERQE